MVFLINHTQPFLPSPDLRTLLCLQKPPLVGQQRQSPLAWGGCMCFWGWFWALCSCVCTPHSMVSTGHRKAANPPCTGEAESKECQSHPVFRALRVIRGLRERKRFKAHPQALTKLKLIYSPKTMGLNSPLSALWFLCCEGLWWDKKCCFSALAWFYNHFTQKYHIAEREGREETDSRQLSSLLHLFREPGKSVSISTVIS